MKRYVNQLGPKTLIGASVIFMVLFASDSALGQRQERTLVRKPWRVEPVKVVTATTKNKKEVQVGKAFDEDDDWLNGFTATVFNNSDKTVTSVTIEMVFRREPGDRRPPIAQPLHFGPSANGSEYLRRDPNKVIKPHQTAELRLSSENYEILKRDFEQQGYPPSIKRVELIITEVGFEDGSVLNSGTLYLQDPTTIHRHR